jgi:hypothetical protein
VQNSCSAFCELEILRTTGERMKQKETKSDAAEVEMLEFTPKQSECLEAHGITRVEAGTPEADRAAAILKAHGLA